MGYFHYHATAKKLIAAQKLRAWYFAEKHNAIVPALVLLFDDITHPAMPIRQEKWSDYLPLLPAEKELPPRGNLS